MPSPQATRSLDWSELNAAVSGDRAARYKLYVLEVVTYLGLYRPISLTFPALLDGVLLEQIVASSRSDVLTDDAKMLLTAFGQWRSDVLRAETTNEKRLYTLAYAIEEIARQPRDESWPQCQQHRSILERHLRDQWKLAPPLAEENKRAWAAKHAKRFDLLPRAWREL